MTALYSGLERQEAAQAKDLLILILLFGFIFFYGLGTAPLIDPDEGRYAEIPREMLQSGDFITPTLNHVKYFEKPPLLYWINTGSMAVFGQNEFAARFPSALCGLLTVLLTWYAGCRLYNNRRTALTAAFILGSCAAFVMQSRIILTDMLLTLCLCAALFSFIAAVKAKKGAPTRNLYRLFFLFCALAILAKGLIGIVLPAGIIFWYLLLGRQWHLLREIPWLSGLAIFTLVVTPWFILVSLANPEFPHFFFIREHFQRYTSSIHQRSQPFWFFLPILVLTIFPWSFFLPGSISKAAVSRHRESGLSLFLLLWPLVIILFFSLSSSKLIPYILPAIPPLALLIADRLTEQAGSRKAGFRFAQAILATMLIICGVFLAMLPTFSWLPPYLRDSGTTGRELAELLTGPEPLLTLSKTIPYGSALAMTGLLLLAAIRTRSATLLVTILSCFGLMLSLLLPKLFTDHAAERLSSRPFARAFLLQAGEDTLLAQSGLRQGMGFYTGRRIITVGDMDELQFGSQQGDQHDWFMDQGRFFELWRSSRQVMLIIPRRELELYSKKWHGFEPRMIAENGSSVMLANR